MSISPISSPINNTQTESDPNYLYKVCGNKASGTLSCKIFFHRNSFRSKNIRPCDLNRDCKITILSKRICTACRFAKCLVVGMNPD